MANGATEIRIRAERKLSEMLKAQKDAGGMQKPRDYECATESSRAPLNLLHTKAMSYEEESWEDLMEKARVQLSAPPPPSDGKPRGPRVLTGEDAGEPLPLPYIICKFRKPWHRRLLKLQSVPTDQRAL